ncbi:MAG: hypothetical protein HYZ29_12615 [Myxococcales bacterium]|nr:hypothetical protein [Myxococcales bacterium]
MMKKLNFAVFGTVAFAFVLGACGVTTDTGEAGQQDTALATKSPMLNLSHIECTEDGKVLAHFVLLFAGKGQPGALSGTYNGGAFGPVEATKSSGNVWHYNVILPAGEIDILSATTTTSSGQTVSLHNPGEYAGNYQCGPEIEQCPIVVAPQDVYCTSQPLGNPGAECAAFGLLPQGKDDNLSGTSFIASQDAYVAIVKSGTHGCEPGESAYRIYVNVSQGDTLLTPVDQGISHVTYCACPEDQ